ncbi:MAG: TIGR02302 family protein [Pseudomonadota bacterium]
MARRSEQRSRYTFVRAAEGRLARRIARTRWAIVAERVARCFWPFWSVAFLFVAVGLFDVFSLLPDGLHLVALSLFSAAGLATLAYGIRRFAWPSLEDARQRIDAELPGQPLATLEDEIAVGAENPTTRAVWVAHLRRMADAADGARAAKPDLRLAPRDPWALRLMAVIALVTALLFAGGDTLTQFDRALDPAADDPAPVRATFEAWASPPAYTGQPVVYLSEVADGSHLTVPEGTEVTLRVYGDAEATVSLDEALSGDAAALTETAESIRDARFIVEQGGSMTLRDDGAHMIGWSFAVSPDDPPEIAATGPVEVNISGAMELGFTATDDYGVTGAAAEIVLDLAAVDRRYGLAPEPRPVEAIAIDLPLPMVRAEDAVEDVLVQDFSRHPWAGLPVRIVLTAVDAAEQIGRTELPTVALPMRRFYDPLARALVEQRRDLLWSDANGPRVRQTIRAISYLPEDIFLSDTAYLIVRTALRRLEYAVEDERLAEERESIAELLWRAALLVEDGDLSSAQERLRRAQERLQQALEEGASDEEIAELMDELRQAMRDYMQELTRQALENQDQQQQQALNQMDPSQMYSQQDLQRLMDRIQELAEQGNTEAAQQLLQELMQMMQNMQMALQQGGEGQQGDQMMDGLRDMMRQQEDLADRSFEELQRQFRERQFGQQPGQQGQRQQGQQQGQQGQRPGQQQGQGGSNDDQRGEPRGSGNQMSDLAERQEALRQLLDDLRNRMPGANTEAGEQGRQALNEAEREMGEARDSLDRNDAEGALDNQADALESLREGMRQLAEEQQQMAQERANRNGQGQNAQGENSGDRDPLGRPRRAEGNIDSNERLLPDGDLINRTRELMEEIRRRSGERLRSERELDYLRRLLERF